jgi:EthD domain
MTADHAPSAFKLLVLFDASNGHDFNAAHPALGAPSDRGPVVTLGVRVADPAHDRFAAAGRIDEDAAAVLEVTAPLREYESAISAGIDALDRLGTTIDRAAARLMVGPVVEVVPGTGRFAAFHTLRRLNSLSHEEFLTYWSGGHTRFSASVPGLTGYQQLQVDEALSLATGARCGIAFAQCDGVSSIRADDVDEYASVVNAPQAARGIQDNTVFVDTTRSPWCGLYDTATPQEHA